MSELATAITDLMDTGRKRLATERSDYQARREAELAQRQAQINEQISGLHQAVMDLLPDALHPYCGLVCDDSEPLNGWQYARLEVPGCSPITITVECGRYWDSRSNGYTFTFEPVKRENHPLFRVERYQLAFDDDEGVYSVTNHTERPNDTHYGSDDIAIALAAAAEWWANRAKLETQAAVKTADVQAKRTARQAQSDAAAQRQTTERETLLDLISDDPVAVIMLKLYAALHQERAGYAEAINRINDNLYQQGAAYERQLAEKQHATDRALSQVHDDADRAQRAADNLEAKLSRLRHAAQAAV